MDPLSPIMDWQYTVLTQDLRLLQEVLATPFENGEFVPFTWLLNSLASELHLLQEHITNENCPCSSAGENCDWKHCNVIDGKCGELKTFKLSPKLLEMVNIISVDARKWKAIEKEYLRNRFTFDKNKRVPASWATEWMEKLNAQILSVCDTEGHGQKSQVKDWVWARLSKIEAKAIETKGIESDPERIAALDVLASEAGAFKKAEKTCICSNQCSLTDRVTKDWARKQAKIFEHIVLGDDMEPSKADEVVAEIFDKPETKPETKKKCKSCSCFHGKKSLVVFTLNGCPHCKEYKDKLKEHGIKFTEMECSEHEKKCRAMKIEILPAVFWKCGTAFERIENDMDFEALKKEAA